MNTLGAKIKKEDLSEFKHKIMSKEMILIVAGIIILVAVGILLGVRTEIFAP